jgi:putative peptidoglycan lipid II flippase
MLPQGMFSVAVATVLFPALARLATRGNMAAFKGTVTLGLRQIAFLLVPASVVSAVLAEPIVRLVYERGEFTPDQTPVVAAALAAFAVGLAFNGFMLMLIRAFFSLQQPWLPTWVALGTLALNVVLDAALYRVGIWGLPLATSIVNVVGTAALLVLLQRRIGSLDLRDTAAAFGRVLTASAPLAFVSVVVWAILDDALGRSFLAQLTAVTVALAAGGVVYLGACRALGVRELQALLSLRGRLGRS